jgi:hypothetical protein
VPRYEKAGARLPVGRVNLEAHARMVATTLAPVGVASILCGLAAVAGLGTLMAVDAARVPHGRNADVALVLVWLTGGVLALVLGLPARATSLGRVGLALAVISLPIGLVAIGVLAAVLA